jgi:hypothetical protein
LHLQAASEAIMKKIFTAACAMLLLSAGGGRAERQFTPAPLATTSVLQDIVTTQDFDRRVDDYVALHRVLAAVWPLPAPTSVEQVQRRMAILGDRIRRARAGAAQGDVITADTARMFRRIIAASLSPEEWQIVFAEMADEEADVPITLRPTLHVNMAWPEAMPFQFVPPQLLMRLPPLPPELQYRIIGRSLVLWDQQADLIVDILPGAFSRTT